MYPPIAQKHLTIIQDKFALNSYISHKTDIPHKTIKFCVIAI